MGPASVIGRAHLRLGHMTTGALWQNARFHSLTQFLMTQPATPEATPDFSVDPARIIGLLASELGVRPAQVSATVQLVDEGDTVPFIALYRHEVAGGSHETVLL